MSWGLLPLTHTCGGPDATARFPACDWPLLRKVTGGLGSNPVAPRESGAASVRQAGPAKSRPTAT
jgi:hypothetical protein